MTIETIRELMRAHPPTPEGYPQGVRDAVARYAHRRRQEGALWTTLVAEVGVSCTSMRNWIAMLTPAGFHEVVVVDEPGACQLQAGPASAGLALTSPTGFVLTGFDLEQAVALLRELR